MFKIIASKFLFYSVLLCAHRKFTFSPLFVSYLSQSSSVQLKNISSTVCIYDLIYFIKKRKGFKKKDVKSYFLQYFHCHFLFSKNNKFLLYNFTHMHVPFVKYFQSDESCVRFGCGSNNFLTIGLVMEINNFLISTN